MPKKLFVDKQMWQRHERVAIRVSIVGTIEAEALVSLNHENFISLSHPRFVHLFLL